MDREDDEGRSRQRQIDDLDVQGMRHEYTPFWPGRRQSTVVSDAAPNARKGQDDGRHRVDVVAVIVNTVSTIRKQAVELARAPCSLYDVRRCISPAVDDLDGGDGAMDKAP